MNPKLDGHSSQTQPNPAADHPDNPGPDQTTQITQTAPPRSPRPHHPEHPDQTTQIAVRGQAHFTQISQTPQTTAPLRSTPNANKGLWFAGHVDTRPLHTDQGNRRANAKHQPRRPGPLPLVCRDVGTTVLLMNEKHKNKFHRLIKIN